MHFVGASGVSMRRLMELTAKLGHTVSGSDEKTGGHREENIEGANLVVYSSAVNKDNIELKRASEKNIPLLSRAEYLGAVASAHKSVVAISGTHGKTTTTAMTAECLRDFSPTLHIGANYDFPEGESGLFITEACEYQRSFLALKPTLSVILNAELEHIDCYKTEEEVLEAFSLFAKNSARVIFNGDDEKLRALNFGNGVSFGFCEHNFFRAVNPIKTGDGLTFSLVIDKVCYGDITLKVKGKHNILNALASIAVAFTLGVPVSKIAIRLLNFRSVERRAEFLTTKAGVEFYSDYAHHPSEINALYSALYKEKTLAVFQPHTFSRLERFLEDFASSLKRFDCVLLAPVFKARESEGAVSSHSLSKLIKNSVCFDDSVSLFDYLDKNYQNFNRVIFIGAGDIDDKGRAYLKN